jgi:hypothetical protein
VRRAGRGRAGTGGDGRGRDGTGWDGMGRDGTGWDGREWGFRLVFRTRRRCANRNQHSRRSPPQRCAGCSAARLQPWEAPPGAATAGGAIARAGIARRAARRSRGRARRRCSRRRLRAASAPARGYLSLL